MSQTPDARRFEPPSAPEDPTPTQPPTEGVGRADTEELPIDRTAEIQIGAPEPTDSWARPGGQAVDETAQAAPRTDPVAPAPSTAPVGWPGQGFDSPSVPAAGGTTAPVDGEAQVSAPHGDPGWEGAPPHSPAHGAGPTAPTPRRRPGWGALAGTAAVAALLAGGVGGLGGAYLANSGALGLGRTAYDAPTVGPAVTSRPTDSVASVAAKALPSVVTIRVSTDNGSGTGSGWVFDDQGHVITNNHVVDGASNGEVDLVLSNGERLKAKVIGTDTSYDLAALKVTGADLKPLEIGTSRDLVVGDPVIAMGAPLGLASTVTTGIVSALNRPVSAGTGSATSFINAIQTDAAINPGNSGGPLLNMSGQVVGVNSAIARMPSQGADGQGSIGLGFAIPSDQVRKTVEQLIRYGKAEHPIIGVRLDTRWDGEGVRVASDGDTPVTPGGPADQAGLKPGDVIVAFEGRPMTQPDELIVAIRARDIGEEVTLKVRRDGREFDAKMTLQKAPSS